MQAEGCHGAVEKHGGSLRKCRGLPAAKMGRVKVAPVDRGPPLRRRTRSLPIPSATGTSTWRTRWASTCTSCSPCPGPPPGCAEHLSLSSLVTSCTMACLPVSLGAWLAHTMLAQAVRVKPGAEGCLGYAVCRGDLFVQARIPQHFRRGAARGGAVVHWTEIWGGGWLADQVRMMTLLLARRSLRTPRRASCTRSGTACRQSSGGACSACSAPSTAPHSRP